MAWLRTLADALFTWLFPPIITYETTRPPEPLPEPLIAPVSPVPALPALSLHYEAKPFLVTQPWGVHAPELYERFGFSDHNGIDIAHGINRRLRAPFDYLIYWTFSQPKGGGKVLSIVSKRVYDSPFGPAHVRIDYLHLDEYLKTSGDGAAGDLLALAGNTGFTTGPHTHIQHKWVRREDDDWRELEVNSANNSFDPMPYYTGTYAADL